MPSAHDAPTSQAVPGALHRLWARAATALSGGAPTEVRYDWFVPAEVSRLDRALHEPQGAGAPRRLDDHTWRDLELDRYLDHLTSDVSIFGRQLLHHRLRVGADVTAGEPDGAWAAPLDAGPVAGPPEPAVEAAARALRPLRCVDTEIAGLLFEGDLPVAPAWVKWLWGVPAGLVLAGATMALGAFALGAVLLVVVLVISARAQIALHPQMALWHRQRRAIGALLHTAIALAGVPGAAGVSRGVQQLHPLLAAAAAHAAAARFWSLRLRPGWLERVTGLTDYANLLAAYQYRRFGRELRVLQQARPALQQLFMHVAGTEARLAVLLHARRAAGVCVVEPATPGELVLTGVAHPLLKDAHRLDVQLGGGQARGGSALVTGQNGAGKSTLLRTVGINLVVARAFGFCYAAAARVPRVTVFSSLHVEDSLGSATSLYMAELTRASALSTAARAGAPVLFLVDEIFRGTNPMESVAATAALAHELGARAPVLLATHHVVLAALLAPRFKPWCVARSAGGGWVFAPGVLAQTNGLAMMGDYAFAPGTPARANRVLGWLHGFMTDPADPPDLDDAPPDPAARATPAPRHTPITGP